MLNKFQLKLDQFNTVIDIKVTLLKIAVNKSLLLLLLMPCVEFTATASFYLFWLFSFQITIFLIFSVPRVLMHCAEFIETAGMIDGIYRLSGIASNIQKLRVAFDEDRVPNLYQDKGVTQVKILAFLPT